MGPIILLDKSTLQSLSFEEVGVLHKHYLVNIAPVLVMEILADLEKSSLRDDAKKATTILARKLHSSSSHCSVHYHHLIKQSLLGADVSLKGQIVIPPPKRMKMDDGTVVAYSEPSLEDKAILR